MKKTFIKNLLVTTLVTSLSILPMSFLSFAGTSSVVSNETEITSQIDISPRALLTLSGTKWNSTKKIKFYYKFVINDGSGTIIDFQDAYVAGSRGSVKSYDNVNVYVPSNGSYARLTCEYMNLDMTTGTAVVTIYP